MAKVYIISEATKKRCRIFVCDDKMKQKLQALNLEMFHLLYETSRIEFSIYFRTGNHLIEYIKANELSKELLDNLWIATQKDYIDVEVCVLKNDYHLFQSMAAAMRGKKINNIKAKLPGLDDKVLRVFENLSEASQMVVRGGITADVVAKVKASAAFMVSNLMGSESAISTLSRMVLCDPTLYDHSASVAMIGTVISRFVLKKPLSEREASCVAEAGLYHDVGKTCVPNAVLNKPGKLTPEEFDIMKTHTTLGHEELLMAIKLGARLDELAVRVALEHHEKIDGSGYPFGKRGRYEEDQLNGIHLYSRIVTIADVYSALLMKRVYKEAYSSEQALEIMMKMANGHFDPEIYSAFHQHVCKSGHHTEHLIKQKDKGRILILDEKNRLTKVVKNTG